MRKIKDPMTALKDQVAKAKRAQNEIEKKEAAPAEKKRLARKRVKRAQRKLRKTLYGQSKLDARKKGQEKKAAE